MHPLFQIQPAEWSCDQEKLLAVRHEVFVIEQQVPAEIELDEYDPICKHILAVERASGTPIGTARLLPSGKVGRVAILEKWRKHGIGVALMKFLINEAKSDNMAELSLHAQTRTVGFYEKCGFIAEGPEFDEANIPHRLMRLVFRE